MPSSSTIAVVDDNRSMRRLTARLLERNGLGAETFASGDDFLADRMPDRFACVLLDLRMPGTDGVSVLRILQERERSPPVLIVTGHGHVALAVEAMKLGAMDFLEKPYDEKELLARVRSAIARHSDRDAAKIIASRAAAAAVESLSQRQQQVLCGILQGHPNKIIAFRLGLSIRTIETYRAGLLDKLGARGTAEAVRLALAANLDCSEYDDRE